MKTYYFTITDSDDTYNTYCMDSDLPPRTVRALFLAEAFLQGYDASTSHSRMYQSREEYENTEINTIRRPLQRASQLYPEGLYLPKRHNDELPIGTGIRPPDEYKDTPLEFLQYVAEDLANYRQGFAELIPKFHLLQDSLSALERDATANPLHYASYNDIDNAFIGLACAEINMRSALYDIEKMVNDNIEKQS